MDPTWLPIKDLLPASLSRRPTRIAGHHSTGKVHGKAKGHNLETDLYNLLTYRKYSPYTLYASGQAALTAATPGSRKRACSAYVCLHCLSGNLFARQFWHKCLTAMPPTGHVGRGPPRTGWTASGPPGLHRRWRGNETEPVGVHDVSRHGVMSSSDGGWRHQCAPLDTRLIPHLPRSHLSVVNWMAFPHLW